MASSAPSSGPTRPARAGAGPLHALNPARGLRAGAGRRPAREAVHTRRLRRRAPRARARAAGADVVGLARARAPPPPRPRARRRRTTFDRVVAGAPEAPLADGTLSEATFDSVVGARSDASGRADDGARVAACATPRAGRRRRVPLDAQPDVRSPRPRRRTLSRRARWRLVPRGMHDAAKFRTPWRRRRAAGRRGRRVRDARAVAPRAAGPGAAWLYVGGRAGAVNARSCTLQANAGRAPRRHPACVLKLQAAARPGGDRREAHATLGPQRAGGDAPRQDAAADDRGGRRQAPRPQASRTPRHAGHPPLRENQGKPNLRAGRAGHHDAPRTRASNRGHGPTTTGRARSKPASASARKSHALGGRPPSGSTGGSRTARGALVAGAGARATRRRSARRRRLRERRQRSARSSTTHVPGPPR